MVVCVLGVECVGLLLLCYFVWLFFCFSVGVCSGLCVAYEWLIGLGMGVFVWVG